LCSALYVQMLQSLNASDALLATVQLRARLGDGRILQEANEENLGNAKPNPKSVLLMQKRKMQAKSPFAAPVRPGRPAAPQAAGAAGRLRSIGEK
jgi:hypothetical protein